MSRVTLRVLDERIEARSRATREAHPWWPCAEGCDHCCRSLPRLPEITHEEWDRLREAIALLEPEARAAVIDRVREATRPSRGPIVCPMLDRARGACLVYEARPIACRTYGFYTERDATLGCGKVISAVGEREVIWGNGEAIKQDMKALGVVRSIHEWLERIVG